MDGPDEWGVLKTTAIQWTEWRECEHKVLPEEFWGSKHLEVHAGDVLITKAGPRDRVGVSAYVHETRPRLIVSGKMMLLRVDVRQMEPRYLNWQLATPEPQAYLNECKTGMAEAQMNFANEDLFALKLRLPPLAEQRRVADFLDHETARIDRVSKLQSDVLIQLALRDRAARDSLVDELTERVGNRPIRRKIARIEQGSSPICLNSPRSGNEWGVLKLSAVKNGQFIESENKTLPLDVEPVRRYELHDGDVLMTRANTPGLVGDAAVVQNAEHGLLLPDLIYRIIFDPEVRADFAVQVLLSSRVRGLIQAVARGSSQSMVKLRVEDILALPFPSASVRDQDRMTQRLKEHLNSSATLRAAIVHQLALLVERRQALITAAVTGQIDVTTARGVAV